MNKKRREMYVRAIDKTLNDILGDTATRMFYMYLEDRCKIKKEEIPSKKGEFRNQLQQILGDAAKVIEEKVAQCIKNEMKEDPIDRGAR